LVKDGLIYKLTRQKEKVSEALAGIRLHMSRTYYQFWVVT